MIEHHIQKHIVQALGVSESLRFSELKPDGLENKLFDYHLKITIRDGMVEKSESGDYSLTPSGRFMWQRFAKNKNWFAETAYSVMFLVIRRAEDGAWLLYRRNTQPLLGKTGFMHTAPDLEAPAKETAQLSVRERTGLDCEFKVLGSGYFRFFDGDTLESFTHYNLLVCEDAQGELVQHDENAEFSWVIAPDFKSSDMIANMAILSELYTKGGPFFEEATFRS